MVVGWGFRASASSKYVICAGSRELIVPKLMRISWKAFAALSVDYLGMPVEALPLYSFERKWSRKASRILSFVLETGNFGHNRDKSYHEKCPVVVYKAISFWNNTRDSLRHLFIFPKDAFRVWVLRLREGVVHVVKRGR